MDTRIYIRGEPDSMTEQCMAILSEYGVCNGYDTIRKLEPDNYGTGISSTNTARFIHCDEELVKYANVLIVDIDLMLLSNPFQWHIVQMAATGKVFAGHRGPRHKPHRPEVCPAWVGPFERVSGGFFCVTPEWYARTADQRRMQLDDLQRGLTGSWRESDEVVLARIIKGAGMQMPQDKYFPTELRGVHLGDFREDMRHRWTNQIKMENKVTSDNCAGFMNMELDPAWQAMLEVLRKDDKMMQVLANCREYINKRGIV